MKRTSRGANELSADLHETSGRLRSWGDHMKDSMSLGITGRKDVQKKGRGKGGEWGGGF